MLCFHLALKVLQHNVLRHSTCSRTCCFVQANVADVYFRAICQIKKKVLFILHFILNYLNFVSFTLRVPTSVTNYILLTQRTVLGNIIYDDDDINTYRASFLEVDYLLPCLLFRIKHMDVCV